MIEKALCYQHYNHYKFKQSVITYRLYNDQQTYVKWAGKQNFNSYLSGDKIFQYCTCPAGRVTYNFHSSCKCMHMSFKSVCNKEHKGVICKVTSLSYSSQSTRPIGRVLGKNYSSFLDFRRNYERKNGIFVPCYSLSNFTKTACQN